jgi:hypothetical protein
VKGEERAAFMRRKSVEGGSAPPACRGSPHTSIVKTSKSWRVASRAHQGRPGRSRAAAAARKGPVLDVPGRDQDPARPGGCSAWRLAWRALASSLVLAGLASQGASYPPFNSKCFRFRHVLMYTKPIGTVG